MCALCFDRSFIGKGRGHLSTSPGGTAPFYSHMMSWAVPLGDVAGWPHPLPIVIDDGFTLRYTIFFIFYFLIMDLSKTVSFWL